MKRSRVSVLFAPALLIAFLALLALYDRSFFDPQNLYNVAYATALLMPAVVGMHVLLLTGHFDLSAGSTAALSGVVAALAATATGGTALALTCAIATGLAVGFVNAIAVVYGRIHSLIATLAMLGIARSVALVLTDGGVVAGLPPHFEILARAKLGAFEAPVLLAGVLVLAFALLVSRLVVLRRVYQVGSNPAAAQMCGIATKRVVTAAFLAAAGGAAVTGVLGAARSMTGSPLAADSLAIDALAACVIGGTRLEGGRGTVGGAAIGALLIVVTRNVVVLLGISIYWRAFFVGAMLLLAALIDRWTRMENGT
jgi:ribose/xylose/arabinose/galactoside ABC-type transport system permease subunit